VERLQYDEDTAFLLADDAATLARIVRTVPADRLRATRFGEWTAVEAARAPRRRGRDLRRPRAALHR